MKTIISRNENTDRIFNISDNNCIEVNDRKAYEVARKRVLEIIDGKGIGPTWSVIGIVEGDNGAYIITTQDINGGYRQRITLDDDKVEISDII